MALLRCAVSRQQRRQPPLPANARGFGRLLGRENDAGQPREVPSVAPSRRFGDLGQSKRIGQKVRAGAKPALPDTTADGELPLRHDRRRWWSLTFADLGIGGHTQESKHRSRR
jgi:hypothetical protein